MLKQKLNLKLLKKLVINAAILIAAWYLFFFFFKSFWQVDYLYEEGIFYLTKVQILISKFFLNIIGYEVEYYGKTIKILGSQGILLDRGCLGRNTLGLFIGFILAFPGKLKNKIWFVIMGIAIFIVVNSLRFFGLAIIENCCPEYLDINHHFVFKIIVYTVIFLLWMWWIRKYSAVAVLKEK